MPTTLERMADGGRQATAVKPKAAARPRALPPSVTRAPLRLSAKRTPVHPGYFLETRFLKPLAITQQSLAKALGISRRRVNELIRGHRGLTADTAVRLAMFFGNDAAFWMQLQTDWDLHEALKRLEASSAGR